jgi:CheY-like chemotaxis protein
VPVPKPQPASLTEQDRILAHLVTAQRMEAFARLIPGLAHELNNPLHAIIGFSGLLSSDPALPEELRSDAGLLVAEAARCQRIVDSFLDFARHRPPERHLTRLGVLVESVLALQTYEFFGDIHVEVDIPVELPPVALDRALMQQVILNLTQNAAQALKAGPRHGTLRIAGRQASSPDGAPLARLTFADDGPGIPEEGRDRLFQPFFTTKDPAEHTGLGLYVALGIVRDHGGSLRFDPGPDGGSVFTLELPMDPTGPEASAAIEDAVPEPRTAATATPTRRMRILVLDDDASIRIFLARALRPSVDVVATGTGPEALELIADGDFDAIVCDHRMAGMTGIEVYERIAAIRPELARRFILMSGDVLNPDLVAFASRTGARLLAKPFDIEALEATLAEVATDTTDTGI